ncbi:MAG: Holliday junction branch migration protein RuvA, partial [bacterium]
IVSQVQKGSLILDVNGIGFRIYIPSSLAEKVNVGRSYRIFTHLILNNNLIAVYGFLLEKERDLFEKLISVSGIGPKAGLSLISELGYEEIIRGIKTEDIELLSGVSGIGKKKAKKMLLELKDKIAIGEESEKENARLLFEVLKKLGYNRGEIKKVIGDLDMDGNLEDLIKTSLRRLSDRNG